jgi:putative hydrolase of the HAD superfamily
MDNGPRRCSVFLSPAMDDFAYLAGLICETCAKYDVSPFEPHVTIYSGVFLDAAVLRKDIDAAVAGVSPIILSSLGIGYSADYFKTLFIEFEEHPLLRCIHNRLEKAYCDFSSYVLRPHLSLLYADLPLKEKDELARRTLVDHDKISFDEVKIVTPLNNVQGWRDTMRWQTIYRTKLAVE